ncbi:alpha/beta fold hydrolase [Litoribacillus peritrichatus]|uniref:Pimeloyl-ACP methyl ester esterase BioH n=1 Tax=Litoribacillus peritrichatus TaxID=718191 RepID=A0ABP7LY17_9GAMM
MERSEPSTRRVVVIGGWGCHSRWLDDFRASFKRLALDVHLVDLPGYHSGSGAASLEADILNTQSFDTLLENWFQNTSGLIESSPNTLLIGWSYGAMLAVQMSARLSKPCQVIGLGARPRFIEDPFSVFDEGTSQAFLQRMVRSPLKGLEYFISLTGQGEAKSQLLLLKQDVRDALPAEPAVLKASLEHLYRLDVTDAWHHLKMKGLLSDLYFKDDSLIASPEKRDNNIEGCHLAPVAHGAHVANALIPLIRT